MPEAYLEIEEYLWFDEAIQGNVNIAGLIFDDLVEEGLAFDYEDVLVVYVESLDDGFSIAEDFNPYHLPVVSESIVFTEYFGVPLRVRQSVVNLIMTAPPTPAMIANVHLDVLHGVDIYWEEVSSELQAHSSYVNAVPYYWEYIYDEFWIDLAEPEPKPPVIVIIKLLSTDLVNMRHTVVQEYLFNSKCLEVFFIYEEQTWGWIKQLSSTLAGIDSVTEIIGKFADDYLYLSDDDQVLKLIVKHLIDERMTAYDETIDEKYYLLSASDAMDFGDVLFDIQGQVILESFVFGDTADSGMKRYLIVAETIHQADGPSFERYYLCLAEESLDIADSGNVFVAISRCIQEALGAGASVINKGLLTSIAADILTAEDSTPYIHGLAIADGLDFADAETDHWVFNDLVTSTCSATETIS